MSEPHIRVLTEKVTPTFPSFKKRQTTVPLLCNNNFTQTHKLHYRSSGCMYSPFQRGNVHNEQNTQMAQNATS